MDIVHPTDVAQRREALALVIGRPELSAAELDLQISSLTRYAADHGLSLEQCLVARKDGKAIAACLCIDSPGRTASIFIPGTVERPEVGVAVVALLKQTWELARGRDVQLLQGMVAPGASHEAAVYRQAGFRLLTELVYLEADVGLPLLTSRPAPSLSWISYTPRTHALFAKVVQDTYEDSLDCGSLNGLRGIEDILASHRSVGRFHPPWWLVGTAGNTPVGVILLAEIPERWSCEVVYMGVLKAFRRQGYGRALLRQAVELSRERVLLSINLSVDARNAPADRLYCQFGFREVSRRQVWLRILSPGTQAGLALCP